MSSCRRCRDQAVKSSAPGRGRLSAFWETQCNKFCRKRSEKEVDARTDNDLQIETLTFAHRSIDHPSIAGIYHLSIESRPILLQIGGVAEKERNIFQQIRKTLEGKRWRKIFKEPFKEAGYWHHLKQVQEPVRRAES